MTMKCNDNDKKTTTTVTKTLIIMTSMCMFVSVNA